MVYTHIVEFDEESQNYHHAMARNEKEAGELIDNGWTYVCTTPQNVMMFRKRKQTDSKQPPIPLFSIQTLLSPVSLSAHSPVPYAMSKNVV
jgi:hypothetical protein